MITRRVIRSLLDLNPNIVKSPLDSNKNASKKTTFWECCLRWEISNSFFNNLCWIWSIVWVTDLFHSLIDWFNVRSHGSFQFCLHECMCKCMALQIEALAWPSARSWCRSLRRSPGLGHFRARSSELDTRRSALGARPLRQSSGLSRSWSWHFTLGLDRWIVYLFYWLLDYLSLTCLARFRCLLVQGLSRSGTLPGP